MIRQKYLNASLLSNEHKHFCTCTTICSDALFFSAKKTTAWTIASRHPSYALILVTYTGSTCNVARVSHMCVCLCLINVVCKPQRKRLVDKVCKITTKYWNWIICEKGNQMRKRDWRLKVTCRWWRRLRIRETRCRWIRIDFQRKRLRYYIISYKYIIMPNEWELRRHSYWSKYKETWDQHKRGNSLVFSVWRKTLTSSVAV